MINFNHRAACITPKCCRRENHAFMASTTALRLVRTANHLSPSLFLYFSLPSLSLPLSLLVFILSPSLYFCFCLCLSHSSSLSLSPFIISSFFSFHPSLLPPPFFLPFLLTSLHHYLPPPSSSPPFSRSFPLPSSLRFSPS